MKSLIIILLFFICPLIYPQDRIIYVLTLDGSINPASADYIISGVSAAREDNAECIILKLNTPGGLVVSTRSIVSAILASKIPFIVYVSPGGAQAASAGVFITMAANIAVMAPGTNIGAAHPVGMSGEIDSVMNEKITNDAAAFIRSISEKRNRNIQWAEDAVRKSISVSETEALKLNVINFIADDMGQLLNLLNGLTVNTPAGEKILYTSDAKIKNLNMTFAQELLSILSDPNIAYILFMLGLYGLLFEIYNPGSVFPGVIGGISLILALYSMQSLPINYAGIAFIIFSIVLFILEIKIISHGLLSIGGIISLILGSIMLFDPESILDAAVVSWEIIILFVVLTTLFFLFAVGMGIKAQRRKPVTGTEGMIGETGITLTELNPAGSIKIHGEIWNAVLEGSDLQPGVKVYVTQVSNLLLKVKKAE